MRFRIFTNKFDYNLRFLILGVFIRVLYDYIFRVQVRVPYLPEYTSQPHITPPPHYASTGTVYEYGTEYCYCLQGLGEQKRTKYKINGTATTAIEKSNPNRPAKSRLPYSYQEHEQGEQQRQPRDSHQLPQTESVT